MDFENSPAFAKQLDAADPLKGWREKFHIPPTPQGGEGVYLCGNSLGLQPKITQTYLQEELNDWARLGVRGHLEARHPWLPYHEFLTDQTAALVGATREEVVVMNSLSVNLHLMMVSFYRPTQKRFKILIEEGAFPSDHYAVESQARFHGFEAQKAVVLLKARPGEATLRPDDILQTIDREGESLALVLLGNVNYRTGQAFDMKAITQRAHQNGALAGFDLAHGVGNLTLNLHNDGPDFAVWCSYKYLNAGPGGIAGCFVHARHHTDRTLPRFQGWWGHNKVTRFEMQPQFDAIVGAEGWQLSNPPIFQLAALRASMEIFHEAGRERLAKKRDHLTAYFEFLVRDLPRGACEQLTPTDVAQRGSQLSLRLGAKAQSIVKALEEEGYCADFRAPDVLRAAPVPLYNTFSDVERFVSALRSKVAT